MSTHRDKIKAALAAGAWAFNGNYKDLSQVAAFYPAYLAVYDEMRAASRYPYNDDFKGRIPGIAGPCEVTAIYLLQQLRSVREMEAQVNERKAAGWRDFDPAELAGVPLRFAGVAEYGWYHGGNGFRAWDNARLTRYGQSSVMVLTGRARTRGHLVTGRLIVKDA
jgi:hypothetical protein